MQMGPISRLGVGPSKISALILTNTKTLYYNKMPKQKLRQRNASLITRQTSLVRVFFAVCSTAFLTPVFSYTRGRVMRTYARIAGRAVFGVRTKVLLAIAVVLLSLGASSMQTPSHAGAAAADTLNFQARLQNGDGTIAKDGTYNIRFKLYTAATGGSSVWTETYLNSNGQGVHVVNGYLSVYLGSLASFPASMSWDQGTYVTMDIGGASATPSYDGEMNPRLKLTAVPYAFQAKSATQLQVSSGSSVSTLGFINPTGNNNILLPNASGTVCLVGADCGFGSASGNNNYLQNGTSLQGGTNFAMQSGSTDAPTGVIQKLSGQVGDLLQFKNATGAVTSGINSGGQLYSQGGSYTGTLVQDNLTSNVSYHLPDTAGASSVYFCLSTGNCGGTGISSGSTGANGLLSGDGSYVGVNTTTNKGTLSLQSLDAQTGIYIAGASTGTNPIQVIKNSGSTGNFLDFVSGDNDVLAKVDAAGGATFSSVTIDPNTHPTTDVALNISDVLSQTDNNHTGINFGTGYSSLLSYAGTTIINGAGQLNLAQTYGNLPTEVQHGITELGSAEAAGIGFSTATISAQLANGAMTVGGNVALGATGTGDGRTVGVMQAAAGNGDSLTIQAGSSMDTASAAGDLILQGGARSETSPTVGGSVIVKSNASDSTAAFMIQNSAGSSLFTSDTTNGIIKIGTGTPTLLNVGSGSLYVTNSLEVAGQAFFGKGADGVHISATTYELTLSGSARHKKAVVVTPHYPGAIIPYSSAGLLSTDFCSSAPVPMQLNTTDGPGGLNINPTICAGSSDEHSYYTWTSSSADTAASFDMYTRWQVPSDFDAFNTGMNFSALSANLGDTVTVGVYNGSKLCGTATANSQTWKNDNVVDLTACSVVAGSTVLTVKITLTSTNAASVARIGELTFNYFSKY